MKIAILDDYQDVVRTLDCFKLLTDYDVQILTQTFDNSAAIASKISNAEVLVLIRERTPINTELLSRLPHLKLISQTGKFSSHINLDACNKAGVLVAEGVGSPVAPAELCWALVLAASRKLVPYCQNLKQNQWQQTDTPGLGRSLHGLMFGIWGYGKIGKIVAQYALAFGMKVIIWGSEASRLKAQEDGFEAAKSKAEFFRTADVLSLHLRLNEQTRYCVTAEDLALMKADSLLLNTSRSELIEKDALYLALKDKPAKCAAVDVYDMEPARRETEKLLSLPNVLCAPHLGYVEKNNYELYFNAAFENVVSFAQGKASNIVNPQLLKN